MTYLCFRTYKPEKIYYREKLHKLLYMPFKSRKREYKAAREIQFVLLMQGRGVGQLMARIYTSFTAGTGMEEAKRQGGRGQGEEGVARACQYR